jgi:hypothetical protein
MTDFKRPPLTIADKLGTSERLALLLARLRVAALSFARNVKMRLISAGLSL